MKEGSNFQTLLYTGRTFETALLTAPALESSPPFSTAPVLQGCAYLARLPHFADALKAFPEALGALAE